MASVELLVGERQPGESKKAIIACNDYLRMGAGRSLRLLEEKYREVSRSIAPTQSVGTLNKWSAAYNWQARAETHDAQLEAEKDARRREVMQSGLALDYERVIKLKALAGFLEEQINEELSDGKRPNVWVKDYKQIGSGDYAEKVEIERFNAPLISEFRATLDDLSKEVGDRKQKVEHSGDKVNPVQHAISYIKEIRPSDSAAE